MLADGSLGISWHRNHFDVFQVIREAFAEKSWRNTITKTINTFDALLRPYQSYLAGLELGVA